MKTSRPIQEVLPYSLLSLICSDAVWCRADYVLVAFDGPRVFRHKIYPAYKANRTGRTNDGMTDAENADRDGGTEKDIVYGCLPYIYRLFETIGLTYFVPKFHEADDVLNSVAVEYGDDYQVIGGTQDKDAYQYLTKPSIRLFDSSAKDWLGKKKPKYITSQMAEKKKGVSVEQMVDYQTLIGDDGDNIKPIKDMTPGKAKKILAEYGSIRNWYKKDKESKVYITENLEHLRLNRKLVTLVPDVLPSSKPEEWKLLKKKPNDKDLSRSFHNLHLQMFPKTKGLF